MYLLAKFGDHRSYGNGDINSYIKSYIDTWEKAELTASIRQIARFLKSGIPIYNSEVPDTAGRKIIRIQTIAKCFTFYGNAIFETCHKNIRVSRSAYCAHRRSFDLKIVFTFKYEVI